MKKEIKLNSHTEVNRLRNKFPMTKNNSHAELVWASTGRSMLEMLAVLGIIGVLSIGALNGIRYILDKNTANDILKEALTQASEIKLRRRQQVFTSGDKKGEIKYFTDQSTYIKSRTYSADGFSLILKTKNNVSENVCKHLLSEEPVSIFDSITTLDGTCKTYNTMIFTTDTTSLPGRGEFDACANNNCCGHGTCNPDTGYCECNSGWGGDKCCNQDCPTPFNVQTCLEKENEYDDAGCTITQYHRVPCQEEYNEYCDINGECQGCGTNMVLNSDKNGCVCKENMVLNSSGTGCECVEGYELFKGECLPKCDKPGMDGRDQTTGNCICKAGTNAQTCACPAGSVYSDGYCKRMYCIGGPSFYNCHIKEADGKDYHCGYNCDSTGHDCRAGICYPEDCQDEDEFVFMLSTVDAKGSPKGEGLVVDDYFYRCKVNSDSDIFEECGVDACYYDEKFKSSSVPISCFKDKEYRAQLSYPSGNIKYGVCDETDCDKYGAEYVTNPYNGCYFEEYNYTCTHNWENWNCYKNASLCGQNCPDPQNCGECTENTCPTGYEWNSTTSRCENETSYCVVRENDSSWSDCYYKGSGANPTDETDDLRCSQVRAMRDSTYWSSGTCSDPGCGDYYFNDEPMVFGSVGPGGYGCLGKDDDGNRMTCFSNSDIRSLKKEASCSYNGVTCGTNCKYDGTECLAVYLPLCGKEGYCPQTGYDMSDDCICEGSVTSYNGKKYCCPPGSTYMNGACSISNCGEQYVGEDGICVDKCPETEFVSNGVCVDECPEGQEPDKENVCQDAS